jgi:predicted nuclease of predicted toxin-antitoxin system
VRIKLDENLPAEPADDLGRLGHDVDTVAGESLTGAADARVVAAAISTDRVLFALDKGIGDVRRLRQRQAWRVVLFRLEKQSRGEVRRGVLRALPRVIRGMGDASNRLLVVTPLTLRVR